MRRVLALGLLAGSLSAVAEPRVLVETSLGDFTVDLLPEHAPVTVQHFLEQVEAGVYDGTIFHRVIPGFMIQGGGYLPTLEEREGDEAGIYNEAAVSVKNEPGTVAMARLDAIDSATRQFFINLDDNTHLDHGPDSCTREDEAKQAALAARGLRKPQTCETYGYAVFGRVIEGMDVVYDIELVETEYTEVFEDLPVTPVLIKRVIRLEPRAEENAARPDPKGVSE